MGNKQHLFKETLINSARPTGQDAPQSSGASSAGKLRNSKIAHVMIDRECHAGFGQDGQ